MTTFETTPQLQGDYGEIVFEHWSFSKGFAYISLEEIYNSLMPDNIVTFQFYRKRIPIKLPDEIVEEVRKVCCPTNGKEGEPYFVYDYLTVCVKTNWEAIDKGISLSPTNFNWVEIKTGKAKLSKNQIEYASWVKLPLWIFRIDTEMAEILEIHYEDTEFQDKHKTYPYFYKRK